MSDCQTNPRVEAVARYLSRRVVGGTQGRDPDTLTPGGSMKVWEVWKDIAKGCVAAADNAALPRQHTQPVHALVQEALARRKAP